jgi:hypothetical protein
MCVTLQLPPKYVKGKPLKKIVKGIKHETCATVEPIMYTKLDFGPYYNCCSNIKVDIKFGNISFLFYTPLFVTNFRKKKWHIIFIGSWALR